LQELTQLHEKYHGQGLEIIAFPYNQFGAQEPGSPEQITKFVKDKYGVDFTMMVSSLSHHTCCARCLA
jgi:glutathione peroxidase